MGNSPAPPLRRLARPLVKAAVAAGLVFWGVRSVSPNLYRPGSETEADTIQSGEMLLHGFNYGMGSENFHLPLATVSGALIVNHSSSASGEFWRQASAVAAMLLLIALGVELGSLWGGLLGAALLLVSSRLFGVAGIHADWHGQWGHLQTFFTLLVIGVAGAAARHATEPTRANAATAAAALALSLLFRSTLVFFPPLLALLYLLREGRRRDWGQAALLGLAPYLILLPWIAMNWSVHRRLVLLEHGEAAPIIIGGVLGVIDKNPSPLVAVELGLEGAGTSEVLAWAVPKVFADPGAYLAGCARRLARISRMSPLLLLLALAAFWRGRAAPALQATGLLCAYLIVIHGFMSFLIEYFDPLWPLLAALAGTLPGFSAAGTPERRSVLAARAGFLGAGLLLSLFVFGVLASYAFAVRNNGEDALSRRLEAALRRHPDDGELRYHRGTLRMLAGDAPGAKLDLDAAARLLPGNSRAQRRAAWIGLYLGRPAAFDSWLSGAEPGSDAEALLLKAYGFASAGRAADARAAAAAYGALPPERSWSGGLDLRRDLQPFVGALCARAAALQGLARVCRDNASLRAEQLMFRAESARGPAEALPLLEEARALKLGADQRRRLAELYGRFNAHARAAALIEGLISESPGDAALRLLRASIAIEAGDRPAAMVALAAVRRLKPKAPVLRTTARLYRELGDHATDRVLLEELVRADPSNAGDRADLDLAKRRLTDPVIEVETTHGAATDVRHRAALQYQELKDHRAAASLLEKLVREDPANAVYQSDLGLSLFLGGREVQAVEALRRALALNPRLAPAALTLGSIHSLRGRRAEALRVYDAAIASNRDPAFRERLLKARAEASR